MSAGQGEPLIPLDANQNVRLGRLTNGDHLPTALLSTECQARAFNPEFVESTTPDGLFTCSVHLKDQHIRPSRAYTTASEAKFAIAEKALQVIRTWPKPTNAARMRQKNERIRCLDEQLRMITKERDKLKLANSFEDDNARALSVIAQEAGATLPMFDMNNPIEARAFLEGMKLGQQMAASGSKRDSDRKDGRNRHRSRSPVAMENPNRVGNSGLPTYRGRSHSRHHRRRSKNHSPHGSSGSSHGAHRRGDRGRTPLPSTDRYRPHSSETHGRLEKMHSSSEPERGRSRTRK